jgi:transposase
MVQTMTVLGIDIATLVFHGVGMHDRGHVVLRKRLARSAWLRLIATLPPALMGMEACGRAHDWARRFHAHGHEVRLSPWRIQTPGWSGHGWSITRNTA